MKIKKISSLDSREFELYLTLREQTHHWREGFAVVESEKSVRELLASDVEIESMLMTRHWIDRLGPLLEQPRHSETVLYEAGETLLNNIVGFQMHKSLLALARIPANPQLASLSEPSHEQTALQVHVALEAVADSENMGMILRNCAAFGVASLVTGEDSCSPWLRRSVRVSLGNIFKLTLYRSPDLLTSLRQLRDDHGWHIVGTTPRGGNPTIALPQKEAKHICLLFGSEARGLTEQALALCDTRFTIPMQNDVDSINVANSVAVALHEALRFGGK